MSSTGVDSGDESSVGCHDPRSQPTTPRIGFESGRELSDGEPVGVDPLSVEGFSVSEGDEEELDPGRGRFNVIVNTIRRRFAGLILLDGLRRPRVGSRTLLAHG